MIKAQCTCAVLITWSVLLSVANGATVSETVNASRNLWNSGERDEAIQKMTAFAEDPSTSRTDQATVWLEIADLYIRSAEYSTAIPYFMRVIEKHTAASDDIGRAWVGAHYEVAYALYRTGKYQQGLALLESLEKTELPRDYHALSTWRYHRQHACDYRFL